MFAIIFFALGAVFSHLLFKAYSTGEIMARGWGIQVRIYRRDEEAIMFWFTFGLYLVLVAICAVVGVLLAFKGIAHQVA